MSDFFETIGAVLGNQVVTAFVGALVGGWFTRSATTRAYGLTRGGAKSDSLSKTANSLTLIKVELTTAWSIYDKEYAIELLNGEAGEPYLAAWPIGKDTFTIFNSMPQCLAEISPEVSGRIVEIYMRIKGLVAMIEENNRNVELARKAGLEKLDVLASLYADRNIDISADSTPLDNFFENYVYWEAKKTGMGEFADALRELTSEMKKSLSTIIIELDGEIECILRRVKKIEGE